MKVHTMEQAPTVRLMTLEDVVNAQTTELRVSNGTSSKQLATAIIRYIEEGKRVALSCIGAQTQAQALKAVAIAQGETGQQGRILVVVPSFDTKTFADRETGQDVSMTSMRLLVGRVPVLV